MVEYWCVWVRSKSCTEFVQQNALLLIRWTSVVLRVLHFTAARFTVSLPVRSSALDRMQSHWSAVNAHTQCYIPAQSSAVTVRCEHKGLSYKFAAWMRLLSGQTALFRRSQSDRRTDHLRTAFLYALNRLKRPKVASANERLFSFGIRCSSFAAMTFN